MPLAAAPPEVVTAPLSEEPVQKYSAVILLFALGGWANHRIPAWQGLEGTSVGFHSSCCARYHGLTHLCNFLAWCICIVVFCLDFFSLRDSSPFFSPLSP